MALLVITLTEVDGVPTVVAPTTGPMRAGLAFRVGQADETLARRGITHLLEHLVLHPLGDVDHHYNGATGTTITHFHMQGAAGAVTAFLAGVCRSLRELDTGRIEVEKSVVLTEERGRGHGPLDDLPLWRHGARDYGLTSFPEWGLHAVSADELCDWAARYFTRGNAVLWIAARELPAGLTLDLVDGDRHPPPTPSSTLPTTPAWFPGGSHATGLHAVVRHRPAGQVFADVLQRRLFRSLRQEAALSYTAATSYEPRGDGSATISALADALPDKQDAVLGGFLDVLAAMRVGRIDDADVAAMVTKATDALDTDDADAARLPGAALRVLTGQPIEQGDQVIADLKAVDTEAVAEVAVEAMGSALLMTPRGTSAQWAGYAAAPTGLVTATPQLLTAGTAHRSVADPADRLVLGPDQVSRVVEGGQAMTVRFDACAALLAYPDGGRLLIGEDAASVRIEPTIHPGVVPAAIDYRVPTARWVPMPARAPEQIPVPTPASVDPAAVAPPSRRRNAWQMAIIGVLGVLTLVMGGVALVVSVGMAVGMIAPRPLAVLGAWIAASYLGRQLLTHWNDG